MISAEFEAEVKNGLIELPEALRSQFLDHVRVRVSREATPRAVSVLDQWLASPIQVPGFSPLTREDVHGRR